MIFVTGPLFSGKRSYARTLCGEDEMIVDVQELSAPGVDLTALADRLAARYRVVVATETGGGVVPIDPEERAARERAGRLNCLLAARAETVVRLFCGIPQALKGELP